MTAVLAVATVLTLRLTVLPSSVQEAQANPCAAVTQAASGNAAQNTGAEGGGNAENDAETLTGEGTNIVECDLTGVVIDEQVTELTEITDPFVVTEDAEFE